MITGYNKKNKKDDAKLLCLIIIGIVFVVWLCTPPGNKFAQIGFYGSKLHYSIAKLTKTSEELDEWKFHRNNAVYLARMNNKMALKEMDKAVQTYPSSLSDSGLAYLYGERAQIRMFYGEHKGALDDYLRLPDPSITDKFKIALLYKQNGNNAKALTYCNSIVSTDSTAYIGYACLADVYAGVNRYDVSIRVYDLLIDKTSNRAKYYADRAVYKKLAGDIDGYNTDMNKAKELSPSIEENNSLIEDTLRPKSLQLTIM